MKSVILAVLGLASSVALKVEESNLQNHEQYVPCKYVGTSIGCPVGYFCQYVNNGLYCLPL